MPSTIELKVNREYIEPNFPGYKLSLREIPSFSLKLSNQVFVQSPTNEQYSFKHAKLFSLANHLIGIDHNELEEKQIVYYIGSDHMVYKVSLDILGLEEEPTNWKIPNGEKNQNMAGYNVSLLFPDKNIAVLSNGEGRLYFIDRTNEWQTVYEDFLNFPFVIIDCKLSNNLMHILLFHVKSEENGRHLSILTWVTYKCVENVWEKTFCKELESNSEFHGAFFDYLCKSITVLSTNGFGTQNKVESTNTFDFSWSQTSESITIYVKCAKGSIESKNNFMKIINNDCEEVQTIVGRIYADIDHELTTWSIKNGIMEILLFKKTEFMWPEVFIGQNSGTYLQDQESIDEIHNKLSHLCSKNKAQEIPTKVASITDQLEECDFSSNNNVIECIQVADSGEFEVTHETRVTHELVVCDCEEKIIGIHQNEDVCLYKLQEQPIYHFKHCGTLFALGYIRASKQRRKFTAFAPDLSFSVIVESNRHIFLYKQNVDVTSGELRNRSSGKMVKQLAQQQVIELPNNDDIVGVQTANNTLFVLTLDEIFAFNIF